MANNITANFNRKTIRTFKNPPQDEQALVRSFFGNKPNGFFVDVGANEPVVESQTYHLEQLGWSGILIEPLPSYCEKLSAVRSGVVVMCACSSPENHNKSLRLLVAGGHSTLNAQPIALGTLTEDYVDVPCMTLDSVLTKNKVPKGFDFISIDIEGHEMEMFKGFNVDYWKPNLVLLEDHVTNHQKHRFMISKGYQLIMRTGLNSWYVPKELNFRLSFFAKLQRFRKYYLGLLTRKYRYLR